jgi:hypothetical protein
VLGRVDFRGSVEFSDFDLFFVILLGFAVFLTFYWLLQFSFC